jgi:hypothetical protein
MTQQLKSKTKLAVDDSVVKAPVSNAQPNYYDTQVMFAGYPGSKTAAGSVRRGGRPVDPILEEDDDLDVNADVSTLLTINPDDE